MAYSELIKDLSRIRIYMREFFVYGFRSRGDVGEKSARSYDNEKRRIESWLSEYMSFRRDEGGKSVFLTVDSRVIPKNPLYKMWKAASFTKNDINLHFILLDILKGGKAYKQADLLTLIDERYRYDTIDESTLRKKLREYVSLGLINAEKQGKTAYYSLCRDNIPLEKLREAVRFFSETDPLGVIGSFLADKFQTEGAEVFSFKHRYMLFSLDLGIMLDILTAIGEKKLIRFTFHDSRGTETTTDPLIPLKIYSSTAGGRQYAAVFNISKRKIVFYRLDRIDKVIASDSEFNGDFNEYFAMLDYHKQHIWGVSVGKYRLNALEMKLRILPADIHIAKRLLREKRCGTVTQLSDNEWLFRAEVYDPCELLPWIRTFTGRIISLTSTDKATEKQFWSDFEETAKMYAD
jgi:DNA-binding transcriptional ArsR family regulator